jgi:hypothetical protein
MGRDKFVRGNERKKVSRPEPPHQDRRTKRNRTRADQERNAVGKHLHFEDDPDSCTELCED